MSENRFGDVSGYFKRLKPSAAALATDEHTATIDASNRRSRTSVTKRRRCNVRAGEIEKTKA